MRQERWREDPASPAYKMAGEEVLSKVDTARNGDLRTLCKLTKEMNKESKSVM